MVSRRVEIADPGLSQYNRLRGVGRGQFPSGRVQSWA